MFSQRLPWAAPANAWATAEEEARASRRTLFDLTVSNPTAVGLAYPEAELRTALSPRGVARYAPDPRGLRSAREAIAAAEARRAVVLPPSRLCLTASSSESYGLLLKILCDPGDQILVPAPSYPLFDHLLGLEGVGARTYGLRWDGAWHIDFASLEAALGASPGADGAGRSSGRVRAVVVVNPGNPTGSFLRRAELERLEALLAPAGVALLADEVFADYPSARAPTDRVGCAAAAARGALTFSLGGLSKSCGLPQLKLGWIATGGPDDLVTQALARLDQCADTYLSVATPVQLALPRLFALGAGIRDEIRARLDRNRRALHEALGGPASPLTVLPSEGGWSAVVRVPATRSDEDWATTLVRDHDVVVHPGYFFDMPSGAWLVLSLLPEPAVFDEGVRRIGAAVA